MKLDILAIGVHPDDVELSCAGTILVELANGKNVGIVDLTEGELGTRGTIETRRAESAASAGLMGVHIRENLGMADGFFQNDKEHQLKLIKAIRRYRPDIILANAIEDRHPDHGRAGALINDACFLSGLRKIETVDDGVQQYAWRPKHVFHYLQDRFYEPGFVVDISPFFEKKMDAIRCFKTQFYNSDSKEPQTYISDPGFLDTIEGRARMLGKMIGVKYGEGFITKKMLGIANFDNVVLVET